MVEFLIEKLHDPKMVAAVFAAIAAMATVITLAMPLLAGDNLGKRMKSVALEREKMRQRERERMARGERVSLRVTPKQYMKRVVDQFNLAKWVGQEQARDKLVQAGYLTRSQHVSRGLRLTGPVPGGEKKGKGVHVPAAPTRVPLIGNIFASEPVPVSGASALIWVGLT